VNHSRHPSRETTSSTVIRNDHPSLSFLPLAITLYSLWAYVTPQRILVRTTQYVCLVHVNRLKPTSRHHDPSHLHIPEHVRCEVGSWHFTCTPLKKQHKKGRGQGHIPPQILHVAVEIELERVTGHELVLGVVVTLVLPNQPGVHALGVALLSNPLCNTMVALVDFDTARLEVLAKVMAGASVTPSATQSRPRTASVWVGTAAWHRHPSFPKRT
jgi:hypothetical protein